VGADITVNVARKQQTTHKKTHRTDKKLTKLMGNLCCARERSVQFFVRFLHLNCTVYLRVYEVLKVASVMNITNLGLFFKTR